MASHSSLDDEEEYLSHGHPALYTSAAFGTDLGEESHDWFAGSEESVLHEDDGSDAEDARPADRRRKESTADVYGAVLPAELASSLVPAGDGGLVWHAAIVAEDFRSKSLCRADGTIKPRRPLPHARASDFFSSLSRTSDGRWCFTGVLNGWPALTNLELLSLSVKAVRLGRQYIKRLWAAGAPEKPAFPEGKKVQTIRVTLRAPAWSAAGYAAGVPGFVFWYEPFASRLAYGTRLLRALDEAAEAPRMAARAHVLAHRYAKEHESAKDKLVYHCAVLVEWEAREGVSLVELAWWGGLGGYGGKSNWYADKDAKRTALFSAMPGELKAPWRSNLSEIRFLDLKARSFAEFKAYLAEYTGAKKRFLDPTIACSADVRLTHRSQRHIFEYLLNYVRNDTHYSEATRNCQTFAADFFALLSGRHNVEPFSAVNRLMYKRHLDWFLCDPPPSAAKAAEH